VGIAVFGPPYGK